MDFVLGSRTCLKHTVQRFIWCSSRYLFVHHLDSIIKPEEMLLGNQLGHKLYHHDNHTSDHLCNVTLTVECGVWILFSKPVQLFYVLVVVAHHQFTWCWWCNWHSDVRLYGSMLRVVDNLRTSTLKDWDYCNLWLVIWITWFARTTKVHWSLLL